MFIKNTVIPALEQSKMLEGSCMLAYMCGAMCGMCGAMCGIPLDLESAHSFGFGVWGAGGRRSDREQAAFHMRERIGLGMGGDVPCFGRVGRRLGG